MRSKLPKTVPVLQNRAASAAFNVVIAYEDFESGRRAIDACKLLMSQLGNDVRFRSSIWKFDVLEVARLSRIATHDAIDADMIIVATARNGELPDPVRAWVESWVPEKRGRSTALLALMDCVNSDELEGPQLAQTYLRKAAASAGIDFLQQSNQSNEPRWEVGTERPSGNRVSAYGVVSRPAPEGWGLND